MKRTPAILAIATGLLLLGFAAGRLAGRHGAETTNAGRRVLYYVDPMHPSYHSDKPGVAPDCGMALVPVYEGENSSTQASLAAGAVRLSPQRQQLIGIGVATASKSAGTRKVRTTGRIVPDDNRLYRIVAGFDGWVESLGNNPPGTLVKKNQVLATLYSPEIRAAEANYVGFMAGVERLKQGSTQTDPRTLEESARVNEEQLRLLGMGEEQIKQIGMGHRVSSNLDLVAPGDGIVLWRGASPHQRFEKGAELFRIADLSKIWIAADIHGEDSELPAGTRVKVNVPEIHKTIEATVSTSTPLFDEGSRTLKLRLEADNPGNLLRPDMFVDVEFEVRVPKGLSIPAEAVIDSGLRKIVYVETSDGVFEPRAVEIAGTYGDRVTIAGGISENDRLVVSGNFLLDSESRMRSAGTEPSSSKPAIGDAPHAKTGGAMQSMAHTAPLGMQAQDPVCGMPLKPSEVAFKESYKGREYNFCSDTCRKKFLADPERYVAQKAANASTPPDQAAHVHD